MKKINVKISAKISLGFGLITLALIINAILISRVLDKSRQYNEQISTIYQPSESLLIAIQDEINISQGLIKNWVFVDKVANTPDKLKLKELHKTIFPRLKRELMNKADQWNEKNQRELNDIFRSISDTLFRLHAQVMDKLNNISNYDDPSVMFEVIPLVSDDGDIIVKTTQIKNRLDKLIQIEQSSVISASSEIDTAFVQLKKYIFYTCIALIIISLFVAFITVRALVVPITIIKNLLLSMSRGSLPSDKIKEGGDEIGEMSKALNQLVSGLRDISSFALEIGRGNYNSQFKPLSEDDVLGNSLLRMRDDLKAATIEDAKRKLEDEHRNWASTGVAKFSDILRQNNDKLDILSYNVISSLVKYLDANQGGIFIIDDNDRSNVFIDMLACYAYNHKKYLQKRIGLGEGLIGRCIKEKGSIYLTDLPDNYINITSGLGNANPTSLLLVPLAMNDDVFGVMEIASFNDLQPYQIEFVKKIADSIAGTLSTVKINIQTTRLLDQSRIQAEELAAQEEEMRQNMEELRATQEQSSRKEEELKHALEAMQQKMKEKE